MRPGGDFFNISVKMMRCPQFGNIVAMVVVGVSGMERGIGVPVLVGGRSAKIHTKAP